jgi:hypothetical protein
MDVSVERASAIPRVRLTGQVVEKPRGHGEY